MKTYYNVDLVLQGHEHAYTRSFKLKDNKVVADHEKGTVYVLSTSGPKLREVNPPFKHLMAKMGTNSQLFQVISIDGKKLAYHSYTANGLVYDSFELTKE